MSKDVVEPEDEMKVCRMRVACLLSEDTREKKHARAHAPTHTPHARVHACTHSDTYKYAILIAFPLQQRLYVIRTLPLLN
jgi:hypothetical protein